MEKQDLLLISDDELLNELTSRFNTSIFVGVREKIKPEMDNYRWDYNGSKATCIGLAELMIDGIKRSFKQKVENDK